MPARRRSSAEYTSRRPASMFMLSFAGASRSTACPGTSSQKANHCLPSQTTLPLKQLDAQLVGPLERYRKIGARVALLLRRLLSKLRRAKVLVARCVPVGGGHLLQHVLRRQQTAGSGLRRTVWRPQLPSWPDRPPWHPRRTCRANRAACRNRPLAPDQQAIAKINNRALQRVIAESCIR